MSSRRTPPTTRLSPLQPGRSRRRSTSRVGVLAAVVVGVLVVASAVVWLVVG